MASDESRLLRNRRAPQRATYVELFFDVVFVFVLTRVSHTLFLDLTWAGALKTIVMLLAFWWVWVFTTWITNRLDPARPAIQLVIIPIMLGGLVMAAAVPEAFGEEGLLFAVTYVVIQIGRTLFVTLALRGREAALGSSQQLIWSCVAAVPWITGAFTEGALRVALWLLAVALGYTMAKIDFYVPGLGPAPITEEEIPSEHLSERYQQFIIISFGETILSAGGQFSAIGVDAERSFAFVVAFATTVLLWRIYFYQAGQLLPVTIAASERPATFSRSASYAHLLMVSGIVVAAVGDEIIITHPFGRTDLVWATIILGGPALFLAGRARLDYLTFSRVSWSRWIGLIVLIALAPAVTVLPPVMVAVAAAVVLFAVALGNLIAWRLSPSEPAPPSR